jgi:predicted nucleic acid-binding protein
VIIVGTGPLVAAAHAGGRDHGRCVRLFTQAHREGRPLVVPAFVAAETARVLRRDGGGGVESAFLESLGAGGPFLLEPVQAEDLDRMVELIRAQPDVLDAADASVIAVAERLDVAEIAAVDAHRFGRIRPRHVESFSVLPGTTEES